MRIDVALVKSIGSTLMVGTVYGATCWPKGIHHFMFFFPD